MKEPLINGKAHSKLDYDVRLDKKYIDAINHLASRFFMPNISTLSNCSSEKEVKEAIARDLRTVEKQFRLELEKCQGFLDQDSLKIKHKIPHLHTKEILAYASSNVGFFYNWSDNENVDRELVLKLVIQGLIEPKIDSDHHYTITHSGKRVLKDLINENK